MKKRKRGERIYTAISKEEVADIRKNWKRGIFTQRRLAFVYGISQAYVSLIVRGKRRLL